MLPAPSTSSALGCALALALSLAVVLPAGAQHGPGPAAKAVSPAIEGGPRRWEVTGTGTALRVEPHGEADILETLPPGHVFGNLGCTPDGAETWCRAGRSPSAGFAPLSDLRPFRADDGSVPTGPDDSAARAAGQDFDGSAEVPCAQQDGDMGRCIARIARAGGGDATVALRFDTGFVRRLYFVNGVFVSADATMSGVGTDIERRREGNLHLLRVDDQRVVLEDGFIWGR